MNRRTFIGMGISAGTMIGINEWLKFSEVSKQEDVEMVGMELDELADMLEGKETQKHE